MTNCFNNLPNLGLGSCPSQIKEIKRVMYTSIYADDGTTLNKITKADAASLANWQTLFDKFNFSSDKLTKVVPSCLLFESKSEQADAEVYDTAGYFKKQRDGNYDITYMINEREADYIRALKELEQDKIAIYLVDADTVAWGRSLGSNDADLYPIPLTNISVPDFKLPAFDGISQSMVTSRVETPGHMNQLYGVQIASPADVTLDSDFYSLQDATGTITSPATTGCIITTADDRYGNVITGLAGTGDYVYWNFYAAAAPTVAIPLAADGSITEVSGVYTINEVALLSTGNYTLECTHPMYDFAVMDVVVP